MNTELTQLIERYLSGELEQADKLVFEARMHTDPQLKATVEAQRLVREGAKRAAQRELIRNTGKRYHFRKTLTTTAIVIGLAGAAAVATWAVTTSGRENGEASTNQLESLKEELKKTLPIANLEPQYFALSKKDTVVLSENGVLVSLPESAFLLNGKAYSGAKIIQWQEAVDAASVVKSGLSTMSGDRPLETQGMFSLQAFTPEGKKLDVNPKVGVYVQVPVDEAKQGMQLFEGVPGKNGLIDWQNPQPLEKLPVLADMKDLNFYPPGYEDKLNDLKWKQGKKQRDSLYLSFEEEQFRSILVEGAVNDTIIIDYVYKDEVVAQKSVPNPRANSKAPNNGSTLPVSAGKSLFEAKCATCHSPHKDGTGPALAGVRQRWNKGGARPGSIYKWVNDYRKAMANDPYAIEVSKIKPTDQNTFPELGVSEIDAIFNYVDGLSVDQSETVSSHIPPSKVLAFWSPKFNNTILATRDFEKRMRAAHGTCNKKVLDAYTDNLNKKLWEIDEQVAAMGYTEFREFADERVGGIELSNPHMNNLRHFYESGISKLKEAAKKDRNFAQKLEKQWDNTVSKSRFSEEKRTVKREAKALDEEYNLNLKDVYRQLGKTVGFQIHGGGTVYNIDKYVMDATVARKSTTITDPETGKKAEIVYSDFTVNVADAKDYERLFVYLFPHEFNSFQRIDPEKGGYFSYPLNNIISYDMAVIGISDEGFFLYEKKNVNGGDLGDISLNELSEKEFNAAIEQLNSGRNSKPMEVRDELSWLITEQKNYKVEKQRKAMAVFREEMREVVFPCSGTEYVPELTEVEVGIEF